MLSRTVLEIVINNKDHIVNNLSETDPFRY